MTKTCVATAGLWCGLGMSIPIAPTIAGLAAVVLVRTILWSKKQSVKWNLAVCGLAMLATVATMESSEISTFFGFWTGIAYGGLGVGIIALGKNALSNAIVERFKLAGNVLMGIKPEAEPEKTDEE